MLINSILATRPHKYGANIYNTAYNVTVIILRLFTMALDGLYSQCSFLKLNATVTSYQIGNQIGTGVREYLLTSCHHQRSIVVCFFDGS